VWLCLCAAPLLATAGTATLVLNLARLPLRTWAAPDGPAAGVDAAAVPSCPSSFLMPATACRRTRALVALASAAPTGPEEARRMLAQPLSTDALDGYWLGVAAERAGDHPAALAAWGRVHAEDALQAHGTALLQAGAFTEADGEFGIMIGILPAEPLAYLGRGRAQAGAGHWPAALADFRQAVALGGGPVAQTEYGAALWYADHDLAGARGALDAAWAAYPTAWGALTAARCLLDAGQPAAALQAVDAGLQRFPGDADLIALRARATQERP
jgi:tetratricopeptide (TPR) repeat protein